MSSPREPAAEAGVHPEAGPASGTAVLRLPADPAYVAVLRVGAAALAARHGFTLDDLEDLRTAVSEACALLLADAGPDSVLDAGFGIDDGAVAVTIHRSGGAATLAPDEDGIGWRVLTTMAEDVEAAIDDTGVRIGFRVRVSEGAGRS